MGEILRHCTCFILFYLRDRRKHSLSIHSSFLSMMGQEQFEKIVERAFNRLPDKFKAAVDNVGVFVEDYPSDEVVNKLKLRSKYYLLGLYQGIPLTARGTGYGMNPTPPDKISLYKKNIEAVCRTDEEVEDKICEVLIHEIGHYFGMNEKEIRAAGF